MQRTARRCGWQHHAWTHRAWAVASEREAGSGRGARGGGSRRVLLPAERRRRLRVPSQDRRVAVKVPTFFEPSRRGREEDDPSRTVYVSL
jgi:hypothetical protein